MKTKILFLLSLFILISQYSSSQSYVKITPCTTPTVTITGATEICQGNSTTLCASGGTNYSWSIGPTTSCITITPPFSSTISVRVSNPPCYKDTIFTIILDTMPKVRFTGDLLCYGDSTIIYAFGGYTYLWNTGATADSILGILDSTYYVTISKGACSKDSVEITVTKWCTGIQSISDQLAANIYPIPCTKTLNIDFENQFNLSSIQIADITGRILQSLTIQHPTFKISMDVSSLNSGMYFLGLNSPEGTEVKKFIKE